MRVRCVVAMVLVAAALGACGYGDAREEPAGPRLPPGTPEFPKGRALLDTGDGSMLIDVEIAETEEQRRFGLMHRESLPEDQGMIFMFLSDTRGPFWMKDTLIPLSIAFFDVDGKIVKILDMEPCQEDPCPLYDPHVTYWGALEVNRGAFDRWDVDEGDFIRLNR